MRYAIEVRSVTKSFNGRRVLDACSLYVAPGECVTLCGPSGCGKTTLLRLIAGLDTPEQGAIVVIPDETFPEDAKQPLPNGAIAMMFQDFALWPHMRVRKHLDFVLKGKGLTSRQRRQRVADLLDLTGLTELARSFPSELSGGEQQRLAFARALATGPRILLLDEPFSNLDADSRARLMGELVRRKEKDGVTMVLATHDPGEVIDVADRRVDLSL